MDRQVLTSKLKSGVLKLEKLKQNSKFLLSCISEGLIPNGLRFKFNLAKDVNNEEFCKELNDVIDEANSKILDIVYTNQTQAENEAVEEVETLLDQASTNFGEEEAEAILKRVRTSGKATFLQEGKKFSKKLRDLRNERQGLQNFPFERSQGSRQIFAKKYIKAAANKFNLTGAPFPRNLRKCRRNRKRKRNLAQSQEYSVTEEDIEERNPIILSTQNVELSDGAKALLRKSPKFIPTPEGPIEEMEHYKAFLRYRESMRWKWFFNKDKDPFNIEDDFVPKPWDTRTERAAPVATDAPELEAYLAGIEKDLRNPSLRKRIKSNITNEQREFIKEVKNDFPDKGLRVRREDKGPRFVIEDAVTEDNKILSELSDQTFYSQVTDNPKDDFIENIREWADTALEKSEINQKQYDYVTNIDETHLANPKPQYKTHKKDENGEMLQPVPIRTLTVGCGTPVQPLSKLCQLAIEHLTSKDELPRNCKSTKDVLRVVVNINENHTPLADDTIMVFPDVTKMYPNVPPEEGLTSIERRLQTNPSPLGLSPETIVSGLRICLRCNCVQFQDKYYLPNRGVAMGACHACDFADIWMGDIIEKHLDTCPLETVHFLLYSDNGLDWLRSGEQEIRILLPKKLCSPRSEHSTAGLTEGQIEMVCVHHHRRVL